MWVRPFGYVYGNTAYSKSMGRIAITLAPLALMTVLMGETFTCRCVLSLAFIADVVNHP